MWEKEFKKLRMNLGRNIKSIRLEQGLAQERLALDAGGGPHFGEQDRKAYCQPVIGDIDKIGNCIRCIRYSTIG